MRTHAMKKKNTLKDIFVKSVLHTALIAVFVSVCFFSWATAPAAPEEEYVIASACVSYENTVLDTGDDDVTLDMITAIINGDTE